MAFVPTATGSFVEKQGRMQDHFAFKMIKYFSLPKTLKNVLMILVHTKGDANDLEKYRHIKPTNPAFCESNEQENLTSIKQHIIFSHLLIEKTMEYKRPLVLVFVDFQKAFDTIERNAILEARSKCQKDYRYTLHPFIT